MKTIKEVIENEDIVKSIFDEMLNLSYNKEEIAADSNEREKYKALVNLTDKNDTTFKYKGNDFMITFDAFDIMFSITKATRRFDFDCE